MRLLADILTKKGDFNNNFPSFLNSFSEKILHTPRVRLISSPFGADGTAQFLRRPGIDRPHKLD